MTIRRETDRDRAGVTERVHVEFSNVKGARSFVWLHMWRQLMAEIGTWIATGAAQAQRHRRCLGFSITFHVDGPECDHERPGT